MRVVILLSFCLLGWVLMHSCAVYAAEQNVDDVQEQTGQSVDEKQAESDDSVQIEKNVKPSYKNGKKGLKKLEKKLKKEIKSYGGTQSIYVKNLDTNGYFNK